MKKRSGFVSNSSSSSFIIIGKEPGDLNIEYKKLDQAVAKKIFEYVQKQRLDFTDLEEPEIIWNGTDPIFLTQHLVDIDNALFKDYMFVSYVEGDHDFTPHCEEKYAKKINKVDPGVYVLKSHLDPNFDKKEFVKEVKSLAKEYGIKKYTLTVE